jgi:outer membrane lipoprotein LolB
MKSRAPWTAAALVAPLLLSSCASLAPVPVTPAEQQATATRSYRASVELDGRLSVRYQGQYREEALHGGFSWTQTPARVDVALLSPLGQTLAMIHETPDGASLQQAGEQPRYAANVDDLTVKTLGWPLPVAGLRYWLQGFATDVSGRRFVATPATPTITTGDGWHISYSDWENPDKPVAPLRPRRIDLERNTAQAGEVAIRIVIDSWQPR